MAGALAGRRGFTLTELLVVVAIIVLLTSIVVPNIAGRLTKARMHSAEDQIAEIQVALASYHADFGTYPGDVFPSEDINNDGVFDSVVEDTGVNIDGDSGNNRFDYACNTNGTAYANGRLDRGDGVVNIDDLEWALRTTAKNGPYMESIPLDPWGNKYFYIAPLTRPTGTNADQEYLFIDITTADRIRSEDADTDGRLDGNKIARDGVYTEDSGIGRYATTDSSHVETSFTTKWAGRDNGILDFGDDDNMNGEVEYDNVIANNTVKLEYGNADISPDGLARNLGYYIFSAGRDKIVQSYTGYEDINLNSQLDSALTNDNPFGDPSFDEDINADTTLDTGYEDTGNDGRPGTKDQSENDGKLGANEEFGTKDGGPLTWHYNKHHTHPDVVDDDNPGFDIGGDDVNSWNKKRPWRDHTNYGG